MKDTRGFLGGASGKEPACQFRRHKRHGFNLWVGKLPWRATHFSILAWRIPWTVEPGGLHSPWGCKELDMTERLPQLLSGKDSAC